MYQEAFDLSLFSHDNLIKNLDITTCARDRDILQEEKLNFNLIKKFKNHDFIFLKLSI